MGLSGPIIFFVLLLSCDGTLRYQLALQAFGGNRVTQKAMEHEDRIGVTKRGEAVMMLFYLCPGCGVYMSSKLWKARGDLGNRHAALVLRLELGRVQLPAPEDVRGVAVAPWQCQTLLSEPVKNEGIR